MKQVNEDQYPFHSRTGRKYATLFLLAMTALSSFGITIAYTVEAENVEKVRTGLAIVSRFFLAGAWASLIVYTIEMFPTKLRYVGIFFASNIKC